MDEWPAVPCLLAICSVGMAIGSRGWQHGGNSLIPRTKIPEAFAATSVTTCVHVLYGFHKAKREEMMDVTGIPIHR